MSHCPWESVVPWGRAHSIFLPCPTPAGALYKCWWDGWTLAKRWVPPISWWSWWEIMGSQPFFGTMLSISTEGPWSSMECRLREKQWAAVSSAGSETDLELGSQTRSQAPALPYLVTLWSSYIVPHDQKVKSAYPDPDGRKINSWEEV